jgi:hypothetical protein
VGNLKDQEKIVSKITERRRYHEKSWLDESALRPETGHVLAIGMLSTRGWPGPSDDQPPLIFHVQEAGSEKDVLLSFWDFLESTYKATGQAFTGFAIFHFDLPFLVIRSRILGVPVPLNLRVGRYFNQTRFCDLQEEWLCGRSRNDTKCSLSYVARALSVGEKSGDGKDFENVYNLDTSRALAYLRNDLDLAKGVARKLGLVR